MQDTVFFMLKHLSDILSQVHALTSYKSGEGHRNIPAALSMPLVDNHDPVPTFSVIYTAPSALLEPGQRLWFEKLQDLVYRALCQFIRRFAGVISDRWISSVG
jgi:hypothetical protein